MLYYPDLLFPNIKLLTGESNFKVKLNLGTEVVQSILTQKLLSPGCDHLLPLNSSFMLKYYFFDHFRSYLLTLNFKKLLSCSIKSVIVCLCMYLSRPSLPCLRSTSPRYSRTPKLWLQLSSTKVTPWYQVISTCFLSFVFNYPGNTTSANSREKCRKTQNVVNQEKCSVTKCKLGNSQAFKFMMCK